MYQKNSSWQPAEETGLYNYGFRFYAPWLCRFVSVDPLQHKYPHYTPFQYAGNKPITFIDLDGLEEALPENRQNGEIAFINENSGKYLGSHISDTIQGFSVRKINAADYRDLNENNFKPIDFGFGPISINNNSQLVTINEDKILSDIQEITKTKTRMIDKNVQAIERELFFIFDTGLNSITSEILDDSRNTNMAAISEVTPYSTYSTMVNQPSKIIVGEIHTHVPQSISSFNNDNLMSTPGTKGAGVSTDDVSNAQKLLAPIYAIAMYKTQGVIGNIYKVDAHGIESNIKEPITNLSSLLQMHFSIVEEVIRTNKPKDR